MTLERGSVDPEKGQSLGDAFFEALDRLELFTRLAHHGLEFSADAVEIDKMLTEMSPKRSERVARLGSIERAEQRASLERLQGFGKSQREGGFPYLFAMATVWLQAVVETFVLDIAANRIATSDSILKSSPFRKIRGSLVEFVGLPASEQHRHLLERVRQEQAPRGGARWEVLREAVGLGRGLPHVVRVALDELVEVRNVLVHRGSRADARVTEACPQLKLVLGTEVKVTASLFKTWLLAARYYVLAISREMPRGDDEAADAFERSMALHERAMTTILDALNATRVT